MMSFCSVRVVSCDFVDRSTLSQPAPSESRTADQL